MAESGDGGRAVAGAGVGESTLLRSLDYPCTERLHLRRLLAYLRWHGHVEVYDVAKEKMRVIFHLRDLLKQVKAGQLREACYYVHSFAPFEQSSHEATLLALFLQDLRAILDCADGNTMAAGVLCDWFISLYNHPVLAKYPCFATLVADVLFLRSDCVRVSLDWKLVIKKAATTWPTWYLLVPAFAKSVKRRIQARNNLSSAEKEAAFKSWGKLSFFRFATIDSAALNKWEVLIALLDEALQAGRDPVLKQGHLTGSLSNEVFPLKALLTRGCMVRSSDGIA